MGRVVLVAASEAQAHMAAGLLATHGIEARLNGAWRATLRGMLPLTETTVSVEVLSDEDFDEAVALLAALDSSESMERDDPQSSSADQRSTADAGQSTAPTRAAGEPLLDLVWALAVGCTPVALTGVWFAHHRNLFDWLTAAGRAGLVNLVVGTELLASLWLLRRRGDRTSRVWGGSERWFLDLAGALVLAVLLSIVESVTYRLLRQPGSPAPGTAPHPPAQSAAIAGLDATFLLLPGVALAASSGAQLFYGFVLPRLRVLLRSTLAAVVLVGLLATVTWSPLGSFAARGAVFAGQIALAAAFVLVGRVWPLAVASTVSYLLVFLLPLLASG